MQKNLTRLFTAVLMAALLVSASIMSVSAANTCTHTGTEFTADTSELTEGTYYLSDDVQSTASITVSGKVVLCLNDATLTAFAAEEAGNFITVPSGAELTICGGANGNGKIDGTGTTVTRGIEVAGTLTLESGTISDFETTDNGGGGVFVNGGQFTMNDGAIKSNKTAKCGGGVFVYNGEFTLNNGTIESNETLYGAGVHADGVSTLEMTGGTITQNTSTNTTANSGGGIAVFGTSSFTMTGGAITANTTTGTNGGGGLACGSSASAYLSGTAEISGNTASAKTDRDAVFVGAATKGEFAVSGEATISGGVFINGKKTSISGNASINGALYQKTAANIDISGGKFSAEPNADYVASGYVAQEIADATGDLKWEVVEKPIEFEEAEGCSVCGIGKGLTEAILAELTLLEGGTYVLTDDLQAADLLEVEGTVTLCLNGNTLTAPADVTGSFITVQEGASLTICGGENGTGAITAADGTANLRGIEVVGTLTLNSGTISDFVSTSYGGGVYVNGGKFTMNDGTIDGNYADYGAGVHVKTGSFAMSDGTISSNTATATTNGGAGVCYLGTTTFNMTGGIISGNTVEATNTYGGGGVYVGKDVTFNMSGDAAISGNTAAKGIGSGIAGAGTINLSGSASITNDISLNGAEGKVCSISENASVNGTLSIYSGKAATFSISGGTFSGNTQDELISWLAEDRAYVVNEVDNSYEVTEGFRSENTIEYVRYASALHLALQLKGDNDYLAGQDGAYTVSVTKGGAKYTNTAFETITVAENAEAGYFVIKGIAAKNMGDEFTVTISDNGNELASYTGSIRTAAETMYDAGTAQTALADMINYGIAAQAYFGEGTPMTQLDDGSELSVSNWAETNGAGVSNSEVAVAATLSLKDRIELNIYVDEADVTVTSATTDYTVENNGNVTRVTFHNIDVANVKDTIVVGLSNGATVTYSIADYVLASMNDAEQGALIQALMKYVDSVCELGQ